MKRLLHILLPIFLLSSQMAFAEECDYLREGIEEMHDNHRTGVGCDDGVFTSISSSMIGWGIGLFAGIALLTGLVHQSHFDSSSTSSSSNIPSTN